MSKDLNGGCWVINANCLFSFWFLLEFGDFPFPVQDYMIPHISQVEEPATDLYAFDS